MICERETEIKVKEYAEKNHYTILANTLGSIEYVKYCNKGIQSTSFLKWPKGSDSIIIEDSKNKVRINIKELEE